VVYEYGWFWWRGNTNTYKVNVVKCTVVNVGKDVERKWKREWSKMNKSGIDTLILDNTFHTKTLTDGQSLRWCV
jgi:hypothetical protein